MKIVCVYDNHNKPDIFIKNIVGEKNFGDVILKRKSIKNIFLELIHQLDKDIEEIIEFDYAWQLEDILKKIKFYDSDLHVLHIFSNFVAEDENKVKIIIKKIPYINENYLWVTSSSSPICFAIRNGSEYCAFLQKYVLLLKDITTYQRTDFCFKTIDTDAFFNIGIYSNFLQYISGGFDARFFNAVKGNEFVVTKSSKDIRKIKAEFKFWYLLPPHMKSWFVMPYNYQESQNEASYDMERYHMTDLAIRWVHGAIDISECDKLLNMVFHFISIRQKKVISKNDYKKIEQTLYLDKIDQRIDIFKKNERYDLFNEFISRGTSYESLDKIVECYKTLYKQINENLHSENISVIGHGDLCFSNMLFNKETNLLKLIDPRGALEESDMWTNPYYDLAKLSHSICGRYDFFNSGLYQICLDSDLQFQLNIDFDNTEFKNIFKEYAVENGFSYQAIRIYESSLFLSMLPLHMDNPHKVFGFILNAITILDEVKEWLNK